MEILYVDYETRSTVDIKLGLAKYIPASEPLFISYAFGKEQDPVLVDLRGKDTLPQEVIQHIRDGGKVSGYNVMFEYYVTRHHYPHIPLKLEQLIDTQAVGMVCNVGSSLGDVAKNLGLVQQKDKRGDYLIKHLCVPRKPTKTNPSIWFEEPELYAELGAYCQQDVRTERAISLRLPPLSEYEQEVWVMTQEQNIRGVPVDLRLVMRMQRLLEENAVHLKKESEALLGFSVTQTAKLKSYLGTENTQAETIRLELLKEDNSPERQKALELRQDLSSTAGTKFVKVGKILAPDNTLKNLITYHGAATGRFASRGGFNVQNMARPVLKTDPDILIQDVLTLELKDIIAKHGSFVKVAASLVRSIVHGDFIDFDFSSIENRVCSWIVEDEETLELFRQGLDQYKDMATVMYNVDYEDVSSDQRQIAKSAILGCFGKNTIVVTNNGNKRIVDVKTTDLLWDGIDWVAHDGVKFMGNRKVINLCGVKVTPDHKILIEEGKWLRAEEFCSSTKKYQLALNLGNSLLKKSLPGLKVDTLTKSDVPVEIQALESTLIFTKEKLLNAKNALLKIMAKLPLNGSTNQLSTITEQELYGVLDTLQCYQDAMTKIIPCGNIMVEEGFSLIENGMIELNSSDGCPNNMDILIQNLNLIELTTIKDIVQKIVGWLVDLKIAATQDATFTLNTKEKIYTVWNFMSDMLQNIEQQIRSEEKFTKDYLLNKSSLTKKMSEVPTYDLINAGKRNRYTILTDHGAIIVHNSGFGQGAKGFVEFAKGYGVEVDMKESEFIVNAYRSKYPKIAAAWRTFDGLTKQCIFSGKKQIFNQYVSFELSDGFLVMNLPSGRKLYFYKPRIETRQTPWGTQSQCVTAMTINTYTRKFCRNVILGSSLYQSAVQGTARDLLVDAMLRLRANDVETYFSIHDEVVAKNGVLSKDEFKEVFCQVPAWAEGLPIEADGWEGDRYRK